MIYIWLNIGPIAAATLLAAGIGYGWVRASELRVSAGVAIAAVLALFWQSAILAGAVILAPPQADPWIMALGSAFIIWIGFVAPVLIVTLGVRAIAPTAIASSCAYWLAAMLGQAALLQGLGLIAPPV